MWLVLPANIEQVCAHILYFFFNDTATTEIYTLSLHDALPIYTHTHTHTQRAERICRNIQVARSEEHTSELQSHLNLVCRLLLEKTQNKLRTRHGRDTHTHTHTHTRRAHDT